MAELRMWVVYDKGTDGDFYSYRAREWVATGGGLQPTNNLTVAVSLEMIRGLFRSCGMACIARQPGDDWNILEVWL